MSKAVARSEAGQHARVAELADAVRARDDFLAIAVHDLRNPMHALSLQLAAIQRLAELKQQAEIVQLATRATRAIDAYIRRANVLLDVSRLNAGLHRLQLSQVDLAEVLRDAIEFHRAEADFHRVRIETAFPDRIEGRWDRAAIEQIVDNLLLNAIKYGAGRPVRIQAVTDPAGVQLVFRDRGHGMPKADQERVFAKFERAVRGRRLGDGFGLGLWIVRQLVEAHCGTIRIDSAAGRGSSFIVQLPTDPANSSSAHR
ncbi:MAG TPA: HAMP domain-containing sensor histidine kinase [Burkholderiaceae bacterium]|nr:HAMP domain-containing sensor histidine kinase [Burkholderiaceae bacterium]